jgi:hypothetical protein
VDCALILNCRVSVTQKNHPCVPKIMMETTLLERANKRRKGFPPERTSSAACGWFDAANNDRETHPNQLMSVRFQSQVSKSVYAFRPLR